MNYLIVSIHDAALPYLKQLREITSWLEQNSIHPCCIKVIPNYLDCWNILDHRVFLDWLLEEKEKGNEIIQHGYSHQAAEKQRGMMAHLRNRKLSFIAERPPPALTQAQLLMAAEDRGEYF